ncbi:MAG: GMC family oxidoreductase N-terminal domain-containing protein [Pseudomonadota bacterium]
MEFDYIIVGGGSAGATLAARLTEDPSVSVCLLEAGGKGDHLLIRMPMGLAAMMGDKLKLNNWCFETEPQPGLNGRKGYQPRGKALGGSSAINAMVYIRGHRKDYDQWAELGCEGWSYDEVLPYFKKSEGNSRGADEFHGADGPLQVTDQLSPRPITKAFVEAAKNVQHRENADFNGPEQKGVGLYQSSIHHTGPKRGTRCSAAAAYLTPNLERPNLHVEINAHVEKVIIEEGRARGVVFRQGKDRRQARCRGEVILSAGAFQSPQTLMLSGVGPGAHLAEHGVEVKADRAQVGRNLQDHIDFVISYTTNTKDVVGIGLQGSMKVASEAMKWMRKGDGMLASPIAEGGAFLATTPETEDWPDIQLHFAVGMVEDHGRVIRAGYGVSCHVCVLRPESRGWVELNSPDPMAPPKIDPQFLTADSDLETLRRGAKIMRQIMAAPPIAQEIKQEMNMEGVETDAQLDEVLRNRADTVYHPVATCAMGPDEDAVVDTRLRVRGVAGLRVVDASIMPRLISGNTNAPSIMIAEKAADMIKEDAKQGVSAIAAE